ncbi:sugar ABC transporter substrate-binding protein [Burkholderia cenocepacia]|uniref:ABC transporter substrate-binding protein n=1 Tax=Burkholderia cenocepacia TaxID=95486 RepID=UPI0023B9D56F|nr:sugar ABC transporter substrate-binding protein [Burkholderia cenocepacia]MDF0504637.1 sugar ABC transporter substrate-binding protein [Burkholderia cenocepacia]
MAICTAASAATITIASVNNPDMIELKKLSPAFEKANPDIKLNWVVLEENVLRQRVTTDITTNGGQFDAVMLTSYEAPLWGRRGWLAPLEDMPASYDLNDVFKTVRDTLSDGGHLYALPFYVESTMTYYRKDLFAEKGLTMPDQPTYQQIAAFADKLNDPAKGLYGVCLRGKAGWGENMAYLSTVVNTFGGRWYDENWRAQLTTPQWKKAVSFYVDLLRKNGPPGASSNGFNENLTLMASGRCAMWVDATVAASFLANKAQSRVVGKIGYALAPIADTPKGSHWLGGWALAVPSSSKSRDAAQKFVAWATSKQYIDLVAKDEGWASVPPGTRKSTYERADYRQAAPFSSIVLKSIETADPNDATAQKVPYSGIQYVSIPEFQSIGAIVGQSIAGALAGQMSVDQALQAGNGAADRAVRQAGLQK